MQKIMPFLWFNDQAEEAANFYCNVFANARITDVTHYMEAGKEVHGKPVGSIMTVEFEIEGQKFSALNGGDYFTLSPAISFAVSCNSQQEVNSYWDKLVDGGEAMPCGWVTDKFGVTWQIVPQVLIEMLADEDKTKAANVTQAMMKMHKIDIAKLQETYDS